MLEFFKAPPIKRFAAYLIDLVLLLAITVGISVGMWSAMNLQSYTEGLQPYYEKYEQEFGVDFDASPYELGEKELEKYNAAYEAMDKDPEATAIKNKIMSILLISAAVGSLAGYLILEVMLPLIFKNGQSLGKKIMGLCVMHKDHVRISVMQVIYRAILGKYFIGTLVPMALLAMQNFKIWIISGSTIVAVIAMTQAFIVLLSQANCGIHDKLFHTVVADFNQQYIFNSREERRAYDRELEERESAYSG